MCYKNTYTPRLKAYFSISVWLCFYSLLWPCWEFWFVCRVFGVVRAPGLDPPYLSPWAIPPVANHPALFVSIAPLDFFIFRVSAIEPYHRWLNTWPCLFLLSILVSWFLSDPGLIIVLPCKSQSQKYFCQPSWFLQKICQSCVIWICRSCNMYLSSCSLFLFSLLTSWFFMFSLSRHSRTKWMTLSLSIYKTPFFPFSF